MKLTHPSALLSSIALLTFAATIHAGGGESGNLAAYTPDAYITHLKYLASDELGGRGPGQPGFELATDYIGAKFKEYGLKPGGVDGTYFQPFDVSRGKKFDKEKATLEFAGTDIKAKAGEDWTTFPFSATDDVEAPLAFVGYGIEDKEGGYDDYDGFDATGKILVMFRYEPRKIEGDQKTTGDPTKNAHFERKAALAHTKGAKGLIVVNPPDRSPTDDLYSFSGGNETYQLPCIHVKREVAAKLLAAAKLPTLEELESKLESERKPLSRDLGITGKIAPAVVKNSIHTRNVLGWLDGDGSTDEVIVVGAHCDHLGTSKRMFSSSGTEEIHNGADDNASGTCGVLEMARVIASGPKLRRNVLFMAFSAEEMGLLGSRHYVKNPTIELSRIKAMVNFDMIGRLNEERFLIYGVGTAPEFKPLIDRACEAAELKYKEGKSLPGNSDHASFQAKNIPVIFPFTGLHKQYHQPEDDWELINADGAVKIMRMGHVVITSLANMTTGPTWNESRKDADPSEDEKGEPEKPAAENGDKKAAPAAPANSDTAAPAMPKVRLGIVPDYGDDERPGLLLSGVRNGSIAEKAGLKADDRIIRINDLKVTDISSFMRAMGTFDVGQTITIVVERGGKEESFKAELTAPPADERKR
ncbi:MAG: M20/M25/M40 family metallo-hydrolase [Phycisphaerales bacterium]|nr:M20/M25/M40 family metallo-hydrolase [Phycisphaerales bacterium]